MLKPGFRVEGKNKLIRGKTGTIVREVVENRKRKLEVQWDDKSTDILFAKAIRQIIVPATQNQEITAIGREIRSPNLDALQDMDHAEDDDDSLFDEDRDRCAENEVEPEAYLEAPLLT